MTRYAKALLGAASALLAGLILGLDDDTLTLREGLQATAQALAVLSVVYAVPNRPPRGKRRNPRVSETEAAG